MKIGESVEFRPSRGGRMQAVYKGPAGRGEALVRIASDPFDVRVKVSQIRACKVNGNDVRSGKLTKRGNMTTSVERRRSEAREYRNRAKAAGLDTYTTDQMGLKELREAVEEAEAALAEEETRVVRKTKTKDKKVPKTKTAKAKTSKKTRKVEEVEEAPKKRGRPRKVVEEVAEAPKKRGRPRKTDVVEAPKRRGRPKGSGKKVAAEETTTKRGPGRPRKNPDAPRPEPKHVEGNPFRKGSNNYLIYTMLIKGGKRIKLAEKLSEKVELGSYTGREGDITLSDYDKRIVLAAHTLKDKFGYEVVTEGRGMEDGTIRVIPPSNGKVTSGKSAKKGKTKVRAK